MANMRLRKALYGSAFLVVLPALLILWARAAEPNVTLPIFGSLGMGAALTVCGAGLMAAGMRDLWRFGGGLPMNAFPPPNLVKCGTFRWIPHPIYTGFVGVCLGVSMAAHSPAGLWLITPVAALGSAALVWGYELPDMRLRFGDTLHILPADEETRPSGTDRARFLLCAVVPWVGLYELTTRMGVPGARFQFGFEVGLPVWAWTAIIYESIYVAVAAAPWCARTRRDLRRLMISIWVATAVVFPLYWVVPSSSPHRWIGADSWASKLLRYERDAYPAAAFPSFHVLWAVFIARLYRPRWAGAIYAAAVSASCVTTGMHYIGDVAAALLMAPVFLYPRHAWECLRNVSERLANSWREWRLGPVRIINHAIYGGFSSFVHVAIVMTVAGPAPKWQVLATALAGLLGAGVWAQWVEGSSRLRRPFGFYGGLIAVGICCMFFEERWILLGAHCLAAPWLQALGRLRCLVNGCCHGCAAPEEIGITVTHPRSRVTRLANLAGVPVHATQLYSILSNVLLGAVLMRLWLSGSPVTLVGGVYAIGNGCARFVEEAYRGEPQTKSVGGLRLYQWIAAASLAMGPVLTSIASAAAPPLTLSGSNFVWAAAFGALAGAALGVDFPESEKPFARLT